MEIFSAGFFFRPFDVPRDFRRFPKRISTPNPVITTKPGVSGIKTPWLTAPRKPFLNRCFCVCRPFRRYAPHPERQIFPYLKYFDIGKILPRSEPFPSRLPCRGFLGSTAVIDCIDFRARRCARG